MTLIISELTIPKLTSSHMDFLNWQLALEFSGIGVWEYNINSAQVYLSEGTKTILGISDSFFGSEVIVWYERVHPEDREICLQAFQDHLKGMNPLYICEYRIKCNDGNYKWLRDRGQVIEWDDNNHPKRLIGTHTDITTQKQNEETIRNSLNIVTGQNNQLKNFAHIVTHNLKQHAGNFESLLNFYNNSYITDEREEIMEHLTTVSLSLTKTITNLNDVVNVQNSKFNKIKKIYIAKEINQTLSLLKFFISENKATVHNNVNKRLFLYYNVSYFESIIQNLLSNAIKYKHPDRDPVISIDGFYDKQMFKLKVSDNGIGIDLEKYGKDIFGLYKTFHYNKDAEGVGLYLIKNQIESFGGTISVESQVDVGTTFTIHVKSKKD